MQKINIDLNSLFNLSYNFENLKLLLTTISKNQDIFEARMKEIESKLNDNSRNIELLKSIELYGVSKSDKKLNENEKKENVETIKTYEENDSKTNNELDRRVLLLEEKVKSLYNFIPSFPEDKTITLKSILDEHKTEIINNSSDIKEMMEQMSKMKNDMDKIMVKVNELSVYDIFKDIPDTGGDVETSKLLIQALDKKTQERFNLIDEKMKNDEAQTLKLKNEFNNFKNSTSFDKRNLESLKEQLFKLGSEVDLNNKNINERIKKNKNEIDSIKKNENKHIKEINNKITDINNQILTLSNSIDMLKEEKDKSKNLDEEEFSTIQKGLVNNDALNDLKESLLKKINNLEKKYHSLNMEIKNEFFEKEISEIKTELNNRKPTPQDFYGLTIQVQQFNELLEALKDENSSLQNDLKKTKDTISSLTKRYEVIISQSMLSNKTDEPLNDNKIEGVLQKFDDYVEISIFNEFITEQSKFAEKLKKDFDVYKHFYDEIIETLKKAASIQDLKNLEDYFTDLLNEFKDKVYKLFPKKSDMNKNFKSLELQIKEIYEYLNKKDEQADKWLIAKKPLGGFSCASCENYLGDLKENNEQVIWNKFPDRENIHSNYDNKVGSGYSRLLNLVNIKEIKNDNLFNSTMTKLDYGSYKKESNNIKNDITRGTKESSSIEKNKHNMNVTMYNNSKKHLIEDLKNPNITNANLSYLAKNNFSHENAKFGLTSTENINDFKEMKIKKSNKVLPPINISKEESNLKDLNQKAGNYLEEITDYKNQKEIPKVTRIIKKKK